MSAAVTTPGEARPGWRVLAELLAAPGRERPYASAEAIFADLAKASEPFRGLDYERLGGQGVSATRAPVDQRRLLGRARPLPPGGESAVGSGAWHPIPSLAPTDLLDARGQFDHVAVI